MYKDLQVFTFLTGHAFLVSQNFMSNSEFCFRGCKDGTNAPALCQHVYDVMGCGWNMPGNYNPGFDECDGVSGEVCLKFQTIPTRLSTQNDIS
jgi:hypothetical protein